jgi:large subunit ribosomal protein L30e
MAEEKDTTEDIENAKQEAAEDREEEAETEADTEGGDESQAQEEEQPEARPKKKKKVVRRRKTKKERENALTAAVRLAVESGKVEFGARAGVSAAREGKAKLFVVALNTPSEMRARVEGLAKKSKVPLVEFDGSTIELGSVCGKPFPVSVLSVYEEGTSNIMELAKKK